MTFQKGWLGVVFELVLWLWLRSWLRVISTQLVVEALGSSQIYVSRIERGLTHDNDFTHRYREWLNAA